MSDIVERLRKLRYVHVPVASQLMAEAVTEIERLQEIVSGYTDGILAVTESKQTYEQSDDYSVNSNTIRLTAEEREAIECFARMKWNTNGIEYHAATLRNLLERMK